MKQTLLTLALVAALTALGCGAGGAARPAGGTVTPFVLDDVDGQPFRLADHLGTEVILISFWATWCEPCKKEMGHLQGLYDAHRGEGLLVVSVSMDEPESQGDVRPWVKSRGFTYPVVLDRESRVTQSLNPRRAAPYSVIIGRDGRIAWSHEGFVPGDETRLEAAVVAALGGPAPVAVPTPASQAHTDAD